MVGLEHHEASHASFYYFIIHLQHRPSLQRNDAFKE